MAIVTKKCYYSNTSKIILFDFYSRHEFPNSIRLQQPPNTASPFTVEEALYVLGKNILGKNVTDRIFPVAKTIAKGVGQVGQGLSTFGELIPPVEFDGSPLKLLPGRKIKRAYISYIQYLEINVYMFPKVNFLKL